MLNMVFGVKASQNKSVGLYRNNISMGNGLQDLKPGQLSLVRNI